ncbi:unnamed protein product [Closterium sp. NIES-53]
MIDRVPALRSGAAPALQKGDLPTQQVDGFYHPTSRRVLPSQNVTFDESVPFHRLFPYRSAPPPPPPLFLAPGPPLVDPLPPQGLAPSGVSQVDPIPGTAPIEVAVGSGAAPGAASSGAEPGGAEPGGVELGGVEPGGTESEVAKSGGAEPGGAKPERVEPGGAESEGAEFGGAESRGAASSGGPTGASQRLSPRPEPLSPQQLREWLVWCACPQSGAAGAGDSAVGDTGAGGAGVTTRAGGTGGAAAAGLGGARTGPGGAGVGGTGAGDTGVGAGGAGAGCTGVGGAGAGGTGTGGARARGAGAVDPGAGGAGGTVRPCPYFIPLLQQVLGVPSSPHLTPPLLCPPPDQTQQPLQPASPLPAPSPCTEQSGGLTEHREPASRPVSPVRTARRVLRSHPPPVPGTHAVALHPSFESTTTSALVAEMLDFAATCLLDYVTALVAESESASPTSVGGECALGTDVFEDRQEDFECLAAAVPRFASVLLAPAGDPDALDIPTSRSYAEAITGSPPTFKARYVARGFSQQQGVDYFQTFSPTPKMTALRVLLHVAAQRDYELHSLDFSTTFLQGSLNEEIWLRRPPGFTGMSGIRLVLGGRGPVVLTGHADASSVEDPATQRSSHGYTFSLGSGSVSWRSTCLSLVLSSSCEAEIYAGAMAAQELHWLTYLLTHLGEQPRSPPVLYQRGQLRLAYVATRANIADIFTKALPPGDHQRFSKVLGLVPTLPHLLTA